MAFPVSIFSSHPGLGGGPTNFSTMFCNVDGALNSLSTSKDGSQVVVAGRNGMFLFIWLLQCIIQSLYDFFNFNCNQVCYSWPVLSSAFSFMFLLFWFGLVFKVIGIEDSGFAEKTNLRVGRINLNFSITDVQWHPVDGKYSFINILIINQILIITFSIGLSYDVAKTMEHPMMLCYVTAVFTVGRNMISLIMDEICFIMKSVHIRQCITEFMVDSDTCRSSWGVQGPPYFGLKKKITGGTCKKSQQVKQNKTFPPPPPLAQGLYSPLVDSEHDWNNLMR